MKKSILKPALCLLLGVIFSNLFACTTKDSAVTVNDLSNTVTERSYVKDVYDKSGNKIMEVRVEYLGKSPDPGFPSYSDSEAMKFNPDFYHTSFSNLVKESESKNRDIVFDSMDMWMKDGTRLWKFNSLTRDQIANQIRNEDGKDTYTIKPDQTVFLKNASVGLAKSAGEFNREYTIIYKGDKIKFNTPLIYEK